MEKTVVRSTAVMDGDKNFKRGDGGFTPFYDPRWKRQALNRGESWRRSKQGIQANGVMGAAKPGPRPVPSGTTTGRWSPAQAATRLNPVPPSVKNKAPASTT